MDSESDVNQWLESLRGGQSVALLRLFDHYKPRLRRLIQLQMDARLATRAESEDVLQEAYLDAVRQVKSYVERQDVDFFVWLRGITMQRLMKFHRFHLQTQRRAVRREVALPDRSSVNLFRQLAASVSTPSQHLQKREQRHQVQSAVDSLAEHDREVILMRHFEFLSNREVAQTLGIKESTATMRYGRALARLKENLLKVSQSGESMS